MLTNTIAAISTGGNSSGINIIRISGENSRNIINNIFNNAKKLEHQKIIYGKIFDKSNRAVDEVLVSYFKAPNSYTGEDICEINCHGGRKVTLEILELVLKNGARLAEAGEFSKIAFLNGKMDLSKAEGIIDVINAKTELQAKMAVNQLEGGLKDIIKTERTKLINMLANIEVNIDYPEYDYEELKQDRIIDTLKEIKSTLQKYIDDYNNGKYLKEGINVAILGGTNAGKSSLLNVLAKQEKAIVTEIEGTTRDVIEETVVIGDVVLNIADTAGIRDTDDVVEKIGIKKSLQMIDKVDLIIYIIDITKGITNKDEELLKLIADRKKECIVCINKIDISRETINSICVNKLRPHNAIYTSFTSKEGIDNLKKEIALKSVSGELNKTEDLIIINERHKDLIIKSIESLDKSIYAVENDPKLDIIEIEIKNAANKLGEIIGAEVSEDVINTIFEKFCLGK